MKDIFNPKKKMNRIDYFGYSFLLGLISFIVGILICYANNIFSILLISIILISLTVFAINITIKRLYDIGRPNTHCFLLLVPFYNIYLSLVLLFKKGIRE